MSTLGTALVIVLLFLVGGSSGAHAQTPEPVNRAGLVVQHGDGSVITRCVAFTEDEITGEELLRRSGLSLTVDPTMGFGTAVCKLDGEGCDYPQENCWCQCQGNPCVYWTYALLRPDGTWQLAGIGATGRRVRPGDVDGWAWGPGTPGSGTTPPPITFEDICPNEAAEEEPTMHADVSQGLVEGELTPSAEPVPETDSEEKALETIEGDRSAPAEPSEERPRVRSSPSVAQRRVAARPVSSPTEQTTVGPARSSPSDTPTLVQPIDSADLAAKPQATVTGSAGGTAATPRRDHGNYAVFAVIVMALVGWLGFTRAKR